jgi:hypothetical protein
MSRLVLRLTAAGIAAGALLLPGSARAEILRLESGRIVQCSVDRTYLDADFLRVQVHSTGGVVRLAWKHLVPEDRERWQIELGLKESAEASELKVDGHKVLFVNNQELRGLVLNPEDLKGPATNIIRVQTQGRIEEYPRSQVAAVEPVRLDLAQVYTPEQAYQRRLEEIRPANGHGHFDLAEYARKIGAYARAKEHYAAAKDDGDFAQTPNGRRVESLLVKLEVVLRNLALKEQVDAVSQVLRTARGRGREFTFKRLSLMYRDARLEVGRLRKANPDADLQKEFRLPDLATRVETERRAFFQKALPVEIYNRYRSHLQAKAREAKVKDFPPSDPPQVLQQKKAQGTFESARQYAARGVVDDLWKGLMKDVGSSDEIEKHEALVAKAMERGTPPPVLTEEQKSRFEEMAKADKLLKQELLDFWTNRSKSFHTTTAYGYGSFIVTPRKPLPQAGRSAPGGNAPRGGGGRNQPPRGQGATSTPAASPIPPDEWYDKANQGERMNWLQSYGAERNGLFEVMRAWTEECEACTGLGYKVASVAATGEQEAQMCTTCNQCGVVKKVKWR